MFTTKIDTSDLRKIEQALSDDLKRDIAQSVADEAVVPELAKEPFRTTRKTMIFVSAKQRAFVISAIKSGAIQVPYVRTGKIGMTQKHATTQGVDVVVPVEYSDLVRTKGQQARIHQGVWPTTDDIAEKIESDTAEVIGTAKVIERLKDVGLT